MDDVCDSIRIRENWFNGHSQQALDRRLIDEIIRMIVPAFTLKVRHAGTSDLASEACSQQAKIVRMIVCAFTLKVSHAARPISIRLVDLNTRPA
jgi:hypothetical protein